MSGGSDMREGAARSPSAEWSPERWRRMRAVFEAAIAEPPDLRRGFVAREIADDAELREEVDALLVQHAALDAFLEPPRTFRAEPPSFAPGREIGGCKLLSVLGRGGMGVVYLAQQEKPRRHVALKLICSPWPSPRAVRRFEHEVSILARLLHPGIAQVYEAGTVRVAEGDVPWMAMELVDGASLLDHARSHGLGTRERLQLFVKVCDAVQHAHQKGVIHRDLKPDNVLVDSSGQPKVLDFGVALATDPELRLSTMSSEGRCLVGTLPYMAPEQVGGDARDVDTRTDVYALGVVLYELLSGRLPHDLEHCSIPEALRILGEDPPARLSSSDPRLRGDLDTIVAKALEKDRDRRYSSPGELARDLELHLADEPIGARPASTLYRLSRFARRNKTLVAGVATACVALLGGTIGTTIGMVEARTAGRLSEQRREQAEKSLRIANEVRTFLRGMLERVRPDIARGLDTTLLKAMLDEAAAQLDGGFDAQPEVEAALRLTIGTSYETLGAHEVAEAHKRRALELYRRAQTEPSPELVDACTQLASVLVQRSKLEEAEALAREALDLAGTLWGAASTDAARMTHNLARVFIKGARWSEAEPLLRESIAIHERERGSVDEDVAVGQGDLALVMSRTGRLDEAERLARSSLTILRGLKGEMNTEVLDSLRTLHSVHFARREFDQAAELLAESIEIARRLHGDLHPTLANELGNLGFLLATLGDLEGAEAALRECVEILERRELTDQREYALKLGSLAEVLQRLGRLDDAESAYRRALAVHRELDLDRDPLRFDRLCAFGKLLWERGSLDEALETLAEAELVGERSRPAVDPRMIELRGWMDGVVAQMSR